MSDGEFTFHADTLFSALCHEAIKQGINITEPVEAVKSGCLAFSDGLPFIQNRFYIPKPLKPVVSEIKGNPTSKKAYKKLTYIPVDMLQAYMDGALAPDNEYEKFCKLGVYELQEKVSVRGLLEPMPYSVGLYRFSEGNGIYICVGCNDSKILKLFEELLKGLSYTGIGGKVSAGLGRFEVERCEIPVEMDKRLKDSLSKTVMTLSGCMPRESELESVVKDAFYLLSKKSGFVQSDNYAENFVKKKDFYLFRAGSCFASRFTGDVYDVSLHGNHPVYRYAKPMFLGVD